MLVVMMDDQGGGMYISSYTTVSVSQGSYTSCCAQVGLCICLVGAEASCIPSVIYPLAPAAPAAPALGLIGQRDVVMTMSLSF